MDCKGVRNQVSGLIRGGGRWCLYEVGRAGEEQVWGRHQEFEEGHVKREVPVSHWNTDI